MIHTGINTDKTHKKMNVKMKIIMSFLMHAGFGQ